MNLKINVFLNCFQLLIFLWGTLTIGKRRAEHFGVEEDREPVVVAVGRQTRVLVKG